MAQENPGQKRSRRRGWCTRHISGWWTPRMEGLPGLVHGSMEHELHLCGKLGNAVGLESLAICRCDRNASQLDPSVAGIGLVELSVSVIQVLFESLPSLAGIPFWSGKDCHGEHATLRGAVAA
jgi:hypothetical protein